MSRKFLSGVIVENGSLAVGLSAPLAGGVGVIGIANAVTVPSTTPSGGGVLYSESGALKWRDSSGAVQVFGSATVSAPVTLTSTATGMIPLTLVGVSGQSANLQEWRASDSTVLSGVDYLGNLVVTGSRCLMAGSVTVDNTSGISWFGSDPTIGYGIYRNAGAWSPPDYKQLKIHFNTGIIIDPGANAFGKSFVDIISGGLRINQASGAASLVAAQNAILRLTNGLTQVAFQVDSTFPNIASIQHLHTSIDSVSYPLTLNPLGGVVGIGTGATMPGAYLHIKSNAVPSYPISIFQGLALQTGDLTQWQDSTGAILAKITSVGEFETLIANQGVILKSANGTRYRITVTDDGSIMTAAA
jgi:hypothetical protein